MSKQTSTITKTSRAAYKAHLTRAEKEKDRVLSTMRETHETYAKTMASLLEELAACDERAAHSRARYAEIMN